MLIFMEEPQDVLSVFKSIMAINFEVFNINFVNFYKMCFLYTLHHRVMVFKGHSGDRLLLVGVRRRLSCVNIL